MNAVLFSGAIAGTPLGIDRELLQKGQTTLELLSLTCSWFVDELCI